jgi:hypothetical protein
MCDKVGLRRFVLLLIVFPLVLAVNGNMGFQNRNFTRAAILASDQQKVAKSQWSITEFQVAAILSACVGLVVGFVAFIASSSDPAFASVTAFCAFVSGIVTSAVGQVEARCFGNIANRIPHWEKLIDRVTFNLIGGIVFMGSCIVLLPEDDEEGLSCPFD